MALRNIRTMGDECLGKVCKEVKEVNDRTRTLIEDMIDTMYEANGVGLAAPQVAEYFQNITLKEEVMAQIIALEKEKLNSVLGGK